MQTRSAFTIITNNKMLRWILLVL